MSIATPNPILERMQQPGPKKILACDGGGIRGLISVEILAYLEAELRRHLEKPDLVLGDFFDLICGTSTGGIIATCLATGMSMEQVRSFYLDQGTAMFEHAKWFKQFHEKYDSAPLSRMLRQAFNQQLNGSDSPPSDQDAAVELGDPRLRGLLMLVLRNHNTDSPWPVCNNPRAKYNQLDRKDCNLRLPLWQVVRASTAAPTFFPPEVVTLGAGSDEEYQFIFVDGGMTTYNNPAYLAFEMATASPYRINWQAGVDQMLVVSIGTGNAPSTKANAKTEDMTLLNSAMTVPGALMNAATDGWDMACRVLGECRFGRPIDREFGAMIQTPDTPPEQSNWTGTKQFAYVRYDPLTSRQGLDALGLNDVSAEALARMDDVSTIPELQRVGKVFAEKNLNLDHLRGFV
ncbi:MAG: patatin-like phospholipase family protein [Synechococcaceae cyanobacterium]